MMTKQIADFRSLAVAVSWGLLEFETLTGDEVIELLAGKPLMRADESDPDAPDALACEAVRVQSATCHLGYGGICR
jgi:hypothetical protein